MIASALTASAIGVNTPGNRMSLMPSPTITYRTPACAKHVTIEAREAGLAEQPTELRVPRAAGQESIADDALVENAEVLSAQAIPEPRREHVREPTVAVAGECRLRRGATTRTRQSRRPGPAPGRPRQ